MVDTIAVLDKDGNPVTVNTAAAKARAAASASKPVVLSTEDLAVLTGLASDMADALTALEALQAGLSPLGVQDAADASPVVLARNKFEAVAASETSGETVGGGSVGDILEGLICTVTDPAACQVQIKNGSGGSFVEVLPDDVAGGIGAYPISMFGAAATASGGWIISTKSGVSVIAVGQF